MAKIKLTLPPGLSDDDTSLAADGRWRDCSNVRFWAGLPQVINGWERYNLTALTGVCRAIFPWTDNSGVLNVAFGTHSNLQVEISGAIYDVTPAALTAGNIDGLAGAGYGVGTYGAGGFGQPSSVTTYLRTWSLAKWGENLIASPRGGTIYAWDNVTATPAAAVTNAPAVVTAMLVVPERQIIALGCSQSSGGTFNPLCIRWCDLENRTTWAETPTNNAGEFILEGSGRIVGGLTASAGFFVWTDSDVFFARFVGDPGQTWRFDRLGKNCGLIGPNAAVVVGDVAYWLSPSGQFFSCASGGQPAPINCPIRVDMFDNITPAQQDKIVAASVSPWREVWWFYPDARDGVENSRYVGLSTAEATWFRGDMDRTAYVDQGAALYPMATTAAGVIYQHEKGTSADGAPLVWSIESSDIMIDPSSDRVSVIRGIWPDIARQVGGILLTVKTRMWPQGDETEFGPYSLSLGTAKQDFMASGRMIRFLFSGNSSPASARFGAPVIDLKPAGKM